ncbi:MAG: DUF3467 domain-containing protein [Deltaproteobacteria bacterium]|nr:DUF3467 domain-containing protein [Deltaproteobacteria bacterium]
MEKQENTIQISAKDEDLKGIYSNNVMIQHGQGEFVLDFLSIFQPRGILASRIILSPAHAKSFLKALQQNIGLYEKKFGAIPEEEIAPRGMVN